MLMLLLSFAFSGFSFESELYGGILCEMLLEEYPGVSVLSKTYDNTGEMYGEFIAGDCVPASGYNFQAGDTMIMPGEVNSTIGGHTFSLYDRVIYENEEYGEEAYIYNENAEPSGAVDGAGSAEAGSAEAGSGETVEAVALNDSTSELIKKLYECKDTGYLLKNFYIIDSTTSIKKSNFKVSKMLKKDFTMKKSPEPQILIYHTHGASEGFKDSRADDVNDGIIGVGDHLTDILTNEYGYNVYHDRNCYDLIDGKIDRSLAYAKALPSISAILSEHPSIKVVIDLHRDGVGKNVRTTTDVNGVKTAQVMLFNGLSRNSRGAIKYLKNDNLNDNLAFSLQVKLKALQLYPGLTKPIYLKGYRYNLHLMARSLLIELGSQNNTVEEAKNAIPPLADVLNRVLTGE